MSSPKMTTMFGLFGLLGVFGLSFFAIPTPLQCESESKLAAMLQAGGRYSSDRPQQHRAEREEADEDHGDRNEVERRLDRSLLDPGDGFVVGSPEVGEHLSVLMRRDEERHDAGPDQRQSEIPWRFREYRPGSLPQLGQALEELDDREAEPDQRHRGSQPRHEGTLDAQSRTDPREVTVGGHPNLESAALVGHRPVPFSSTRSGGAPISVGFAPAPPAGKLSSRVLPGRVLRRRHGDVHAPSALRSGPALPGGRSAGASAGAEWVKFACGAYGRPSIRGNLLLVSVGARG